MIIPKESDEVIWIANEQYVWTTYWYWNALQGMIYVKILIEWIGMPYATVDYWMNGVV